MENSKKTAIVYNPDIKGAFDFAQKVKNLLQCFFIPDVGLVKLWPFSRDLLYPVQHLRIGVA